MYRVQMRMAKAKRALRSELSRFARDESGNLVVFGVYVFVMIFMVAGIGIDLMRLERDRADLQYTLDRAVLIAPPTLPGCRPPARMTRVFAASARA